MRKLDILLTLALLAAPHACKSQSSGGTTGPGASGILYASDFNSWTLPQATSPTSGMIQWQASICTVSSHGYSFMAVKVGRPITIVDANPALTETVIPTFVINNGGTCSVTAPMTHTHISYSVQSGTSGLQEALDYSLNINGGSVVVLTPGWTAGGGLTGMISAATGQTSISILDMRVATICSYGWTGSTYASTGCGTGNASLTVTSLQTFLGPIDSPDFSTIGAGTTLTSAIIAGFCNGTAPATIILPYGTVNFAATLTIPSKCTIKGKGQGISTLLAAPNSTFAVAAVVNGSQALNKPGTLDTRIHLQDFTLDLNSANQSAANLGVWMTNVSFSSMEHVEVNGGQVLFSYNANINDLTLASYQHDLLFDGVHFHNAGVSPSRDEDSLTVTGQHIKVVNSTLGPSTDSGVASFGEGAFDYVISNNYFSNNSQACAVAIGPGPGNVPAPPNAQYGSSGIAITGNTIVCTGIQYAIALSTGSQFTISGNVINMTPGGGGSAADAINLENVTGVQVTGNQIKGSKHDGIQVVATGQETTSDINVTGNAINSPNASCIRLISQAGAIAPTFLTNVSVTGNSCTNPGVASPSPGIILAQSSNGSPAEAGNYQNVQVEGNGVIDNRGSPTMTYGVQFLGNPVASVSGNNVTGAVTSSYSSTSAPNIATHTNSTQTADILQAPITFLSNGATVTELFGETSLNPGSFSPLTLLNDVGLFFDITNTGLGSGGLVIAAHSAASTGMRIDGAAHTMAYYAGSGHAFNGPVTGTSTLGWGGGSTIANSNSHGSAGTQIQMSDNSGTSGNCAKFAADGSVTDAGAPCGTGSPGVASINSVTGAYTFTGAGVSCTSTTCTFSGTGGVSSFAAPSGSWPTWLVPSVTNSTTTPSLAVAASAIPNSALANPATTVNGTTCTLGSTCSPYPLTTSGSLPGTCTTGQLWTNPSPTNTGNVVYECYTTNSWTPLQPSMSGTPTSVSANSGAGSGSGGTATFVAGETDGTGWITVNTGTSTTASAGVVTVSYSITYPVTPKCLVFPADTNSAALSGTGQVWVSQGSATGALFVVRVGSSALAISTTYTWGYRCALL